MFLKTQKGCPPCKLQDGTLAPAGTIAYRGPDYDHSHGGLQPHVHLYKANQNPNNCDCFWQSVGTVSPPPPNGAIPIQPFIN